MSLRSPRGTMQESPNSPLIGGEERKEEKITIEEKPSPLTPENAHNSNAIVACMMYCTCSLLMTLSNKLILSDAPFGYDFKFPSFLLLLQGVFCVCFVYALKILNLVTVEPVVLPLVIKWLPTNVLFVAMLLSGTYALQFLSVPMVTIFKNFTTMFITLGDFVWFGQPMGGGVVLSLVLMFFGSVVAALNDLEFRVDGYIWMVINCTISAAYVLYMKVAMKGTKLSEFGSVLYNNLLSLPMIFCLALLDGFDGIASFPGWQDRGFVMAILFSGISSVSISFASFWTVKTTSPTTYSIVGSLNKIPLTIIGVMLFHTQLSNLGAISIFIGLSGGVVYSYWKNKEKQNTLRKSNKSW